MIPFCRIWRSEMLQEYKNKKLLEEFIYSSTVDLLLKWGRNHLLASENVEARERVEARWVSHFQGEDLEKNLIGGLTVLREYAGQALKFFDLQPYFNEDSDEAGEVSTAAEILDHVVFLADASDAFPQRAAFPEAFRAGVKQLLEKATLHNAPSALRLIGLNRWRGGMSSFIPEEHRYLFPWYAEWNQVPPETIALIIDHWQVVERGDLDDVPIDPETLEPFLVELAGDQDLLAYIRRQARMEALISEAIENSLALRLFMTSDKEGDHYAVPSEVEAKGLGACALHLMRNRLKKRTTEADNLESMFIAAFCAPFLPDETQIALFSRVEDELGDLDRNAISHGGVLKKLMDWAYGKRITAKELAKTVYSRWLDDMVNIAPVAAQTSDEVAAAKIQETAREMLDWRPPLETRRSTQAMDTLCGILDVIKNLAVDRVNMSATPATSKMLSEIDEAEKPHPVVFQSQTGNIIDLPLPIDERNLRIPGKHPGNPALEELRDKLLKKASVYWNTVYKIAGEPEEKILYDAPRLKSEKLPKIGELEKAEYEYVVVFISPKADLIQKAMAGRELTEKEKQEIVFLRYLQAEETP